MQLALLAGEAALVGAIVLFLFAMRRRVGLAPLYMVVGAVQALQMLTAASIRVQIAPDLFSSPASAVLFPVTIFVVLLTYVEHDAEETRKLTYGVVIANMVGYALSALAGQHLLLGGHLNPLGVPVDLFVQPPRLALASTLSLFIDVVAAVLIFEEVSRWLGRSLFLRLWVTTAAVMVLDSVTFTIGAFLGSPRVVPVFMASVVAKLVGATFYSALIAMYARYVEVPAPPTAGGPDIFQWLTYRQRYEEARSLATRDALTGLYNRGYFDEYAPRQLAHAARAGHSMSLALVDVDRLKRTNDTHGHLAGDALLQFVAGELSQVVRASDAACRFGGDEFAVVLSTAGAEAARIFADRLRALVAERSRALGSPWAPASITIGLATFPADGSSLAELVTGADRRLYDGKRAGGNRVVDGRG